MEKTERTIYEKLVDYYNELEQKISAYFNPADEDSDLFLVRLLYAVTAWDEKLAVEILKAKRNYHKERLIFEIRETAYAAYTKELLTYCSLLWITPPKMPEDISQISNLGEHYEEIVNSERAKLINKLLDCRFVAPTNISEEERKSMDSFKENMARLNGWAYMTEIRLRRELKMVCD
jgi:hypothetical protein